MSLISSVRLILVFGVVLSLSSLPSLAGSITNSLRLPTLPSAHANLEYNEAWVPAGPAIDKLFLYVDSGPDKELTDLQSGSQSPLDFTDTTLGSSLVKSLDSSSGFLVTQPQVSGFSEIEFNLANNFWNCPFNFGQTNFNCGQEIRQGIAHLIDKTAYVDDWLGGQGAAIDNPLAGGSTLPTPNSCGWDTNITQMGSGCIIGSTTPGANTYTGGTAYHLAAATGATFPWQPALGSPDFCAAADHFIRAGLASGRDSNCVLTGVNWDAVTGHTVHFYIRNDVFNNEMADLGDSVAQEICALFTGSFTSNQGTDSGCGHNSLTNNILSTEYGSAATFPGYAISNSQNLGWWMYTAAAGSYSPMETYEGVAEHLGDVQCDYVGKCDPFDTSLYYVFNSHFAGYPCSTAGNSAPSNYMYLCYPSFDSISSQMEYAPCLSSSGDVNSQVGQRSPSYVNCPNSSSLTAMSAGLQAENLFGEEAYTIPVFTSVDQSGYLNNGWVRAINSAGTYNYFTWLNAWNPNAWTGVGYNQNVFVPGALRQGFQQTTINLNPYVASSPQDLSILAGIYDSLGAVDPYAQDGLFNWMTVSTKGPVSNGQLTYTPPPGTVATYQFQLRNDIYFQDGTKVTSMDVAFSYLSLLISGSFLSSGLQSMTGITVKNTNSLDVNLNSNGPFTLYSIVSPPILPGRYWTSAGNLTTWDANIQACGNSCHGQYIPASVSVTCASTCSLPATFMDPAKRKTAPSYDPTCPSNRVNSYGVCTIPGILIGSGPWECVSATGELGMSCSTTGLSDPPSGDAYTLARFGLGNQPGASLTGSYFRSSGNLALSIWTGDVGDFTHDFLNFGALSACFGKPVTGGTTGCGHWQQGIGNSGSSCPCPVGSVQAGLVSRFAGVNWVGPYNWFGYYVGSTYVPPTPPPNLVSFPPVLYEGTSTLSPAVVAGCSPSVPNYPNGGGYDC
jgi:ABC-type transport system substrate-binding protein